MKVLLALLLTLAAAFAFAQRKHTVFFSLGSYIISEQSKSQLDSLIYTEALHPGAKLSLIGYADFIGDTASNMLLSQRRAEVVKAYLVSMGFKETDLKTIQWKGELAADDTTSKDGIAKDRRVDIVVDKLVKAKQLADPSKYKVNDLIRLNILFPPMSHHYKDSSIIELEYFYNMMVNNKTLKVQIEGHICCGNSDKPNDDGYDRDTKHMQLSYNRAVIVYEYMVKRGIDPSRMTYKGFGFSRPLFAFERNDWERDQNKRVEIRIMAK